MDGTVFRGSNGLTPFFYGHTLNCISQAPLSGVKKKWQQKKIVEAKAKRKKEQIHHQGCLYSCIVHILE